MSGQDFDALLERRLQLVRDVLSTKQAEYATDEDRLHNFKRGGQLLGKSPLTACIGSMTKHLVSVLDMIAGVEAGGPVPPQERIDEKIGDLINYLILTEAILTEMRG